MAEFTPITTQEAFDQAIQDRLRRERKVIEDKYAGFLSKESSDKAIQDATQKLQGDLTKAKEQIDTLSKSVREKDAEIKGYKIAASKSKIAGELGLSADALQFISGETDEEIKDSAERLKAVIGERKGAPPMARNEHGQTDTLEAAFNKMAANLYN